MDTHFIFIHGGPGLDCSYWFPLTSLLEKRNKNFSYTAYTQGSVKDIKQFADFKDELQLIIDKNSGKKIYIIAHSFGALIALSWLKKIRPQRGVHLVLTNWVYNFEWLEKSYAKNQETFDNEPVDMKLAEKYLYYLPLYFENLEQGSIILKNIQYSDRLSNIYSETKTLNFERVLELNSSMITSVSSTAEKLIDPDYISEICKKLNIKNYLINSSSHFPFSEDPNTFIKLLSKITGEKL